MRENQEEESLERLKVMNWNLQTFFDGTFDGNEYSEYRDSKRGWSQDKYEERLDRLVQVILDLDADIILLEELEKEAQLQDIANRLSGTFDFSRLYSHAFFATNPGNSIGCGVLSRLPLGETFVHSMDIRSGETQPLMRPVIQFSVYTKEKSLTIFLNHWKSKSSGEEESRIWRERQEKILCDLIFTACKRGQAILAAGDFNMDISEFKFLLDSKEGKNVVLRGREDCPVYSPWILENGGYLLPGSYFYKNNWERIDHFFCAGNIKIKDFSPESSGPWADSEGHPIRYKVWNGSGYSDHLPLTCIVEF